MRIWIQLPSQRPPDVVAPPAYYELIGKVARPDTEVAFRPMPAGPCIPSFAAFGYQGMRFLNDREILRAMARAESEEYDAVFTACCFDPALKAARQLLSISVVGAAEASMLLSSLMGQRFAMVTSDPRYLEEMTDMIRAYGLSGKAIESRPVRALTLNEPEFFGCISSNVEGLVENFTAVSRTCIEDGAQSIIAGCALMASFLSRAGLKQIDGVPVIDPILAGVKVSEMLVDFRKAGWPAVSRSGFFEAVPGDMMEGARACGLF